MSDNKFIEPVVAFTRSIDEFMGEIDEIIKTKNFPLIGVKINLNDYPMLNKRNKEAALFSTIYDDFKYHKENKDVLNYLIFDYKIKFENSIDTLGEDINPKVKDMFDKRKIK